MARKASSGKAAGQSAPDLGVELSMADFESMISDAAMELAEEQKALEAKTAEAPILKTTAPKPAKTTPSAALALEQSNPPRAANVETAPAFIPPAANDPKKGRMFDPFGRKPSSGAYWAAAMVSILWAVAGYFIATRIFGTQLFNVTSFFSVFSRPNLIASLVGIIIPVLGFWSFAVLVRRAQEMRIAAQSLTDVAYRLVDPEGLAEERLTTISQAVRREVAAMSDGIERTLSRAVELESLLHTEVHELERAYTDNEGRMRGLLDGLGNERQSIIGQAERVRTTLAGAREQLADELTQAVDTLRTGVAAASSELSMTLDMSREGLLASLQETGTNVETRIAERTIALNAALAASGENLAAIIEARSGTLSGMLESRTTEFAGLIDTRADALAKAVDVRSSEFAGLIDSRSAALTNAIDIRSTEFAGLIDSRSAALTNAIDVRSTEFADLIDNRSAALTNAIDVRSGEFAGLIDSRSDAFAHAFDTRSAAFVESGETAARLVADAMDAKAAGMVANLTSATEALTTQFDTRLDSVENNLVARGQQIIADLDAKTVSLSQSTDRLDAALDARARQINETLSERSREIAQTFIDGRDSFGGLITSGKESLAEELQGFVISAGTVIDDSAERLARRVAEIRTDLEGNLTAEVDRVEATLTSHRDTFANRLGGFEDAFAARTKEFDQRVSAHAMILDESITKKSGELDQKIAGHVSSLNRAVEERALALADAVSTTVVDFESTLASRVADLRRTVDEGSSTLEASANSAADRLSSTFTNQTAEFDGLVAERASELAANLAARSLEFETAIGAATERANAAFEGKTDFITMQTAAMEAALQRGMDGVGSALDQASRAAGETLRSAVREAATSLYTQANEASQLLGDRQQNLADRLTGAIEHTEIALAARVGTLESTFAEGQTRLAGRAEELGNRIGEIENVFERADQRIIMRTHQTSEELNARAEAISTALETFDVNLAGRLTGLEATVTLKADATVARIEEASRIIERSTTESGSIIDQRARELSNSLAAHSMEIARILHDSGEPLAARIENSGAAFRTTLEEATRDAASRVASERETLAAVFAAQTNEAASLFEARAANASSRARELGDLFAAQTNEAATLFEARAADASGRARELGESLATQVNQLVDRLSSSNSRLGQLVDLTSKSFIEIDDRLTATTDTFGARTEKAAREISTSVSMLEGNVGRLSELSSGTLGEVAGIVNKFDEHSRTLQRANELLTAAQSNLQHTLEDRREALDALATGLVVRSKEIETVLSAMSGQIEASLERSENRTRSTAASLQNTVATVFEAATTKFADATSNLERASGAIRAELDSTREELRRGLVDLPVETKQTTETLRRAVTDQIGALRELSEVMSKSTRDRDVREPLQAREPAREAIREPAPRRAVEAAPAYVEPRNVAARVVEAPVIEKRAPEPTGWVSTLLRSASQNEAAPVAPRRQPVPSREPNQVIDSLNSISVDIARAIDHNAAVDLWDRYRRGERDVFTRRLYTLRGQETFDDIRRKYEADREFRLSVTRYCEDFEKLLSDVSRTDPEGKAAQRYLTSDTGKVYTMLAHASGRLR